MARYEKHGDMQVALHHDTRDGSEGLPDRCITRSGDYVMMDY